MDEKQLVDQWFDYLKKIFPEFDKTQVKEVSVFRFKSGQHIVVKSYKVKSYKAMPAGRQVRSKVYRMNFAQIYPEDRGLNFGIREARKIVSSI